MRYKMAVLILGYALVKTCNLHQVKVKTIWFHSPERRMWKNLGHFSKKVHMFWEGHKILRNLHLTLTSSVCTVIKNKVKIYLAMFCHEANMYQPGSAPFPRYGATGHQNPPTMFGLRHCFFSWPCQWLGLGLDRRPFPHHTSSTQY